MSPECVTWEWTARVKSAGVGLTWGSMLLCRSQLLKYFRRDLAVRYNYYVQYKASVSVVARVMCVTEVVTVMINRRKDVKIKPEPNIII